MEKYWIWLSLLQLTNQQKKRLAETVADPQELFHTHWHSDRLPEEFLEAANNKDMTRAEMICEQCREKGIHVLGFHDEKYPPRLRSIPDAPVALYCLGTPPDWESYPLIAVVGTRKITGYGGKNARRIGKQIAACGGIVVSGGALGADALAMDGALSTGKPVVGVLGTGADVFYPKVNAALLEKTAASGCLLSEYPPGTEGRPWQFPQRNRIISGIAHAVLVVEAPEQSGALITAELAKSQGRDIYAVPGVVGPETTVGSNRLLQNGAGAVLTGWDIMRDYADLFSTVERAPGSADMTLEEEQICSLLSEIPQDAEKVLLELDMPSGKALSILTKLILTGVVEDIPGKGVCLK